MPVTNRYELEQLMRDIERVEAGQDPNWTAGVTRIGGNKRGRELLREYLSIWRKAEQRGR